MASLHGDGDSVAWPAIFFRASVSHLHSNFRLQAGGSVCKAWGHLFSCQPLHTAESQACEDQCGCHLRIHQWAFSNSTPAIQHHASTHRWNKHASTLRFWIAARRKELKRQQLFHCELFIMFQAPTEIPA